MPKQIIEVEAKTSQADVNIKKTTKNTEDLGNSAVDVGGKFDALTGGMISGFTGALKSVKATIKSMGVLKVAIAATGIGALALGITAVSKAFTNSEDGQNRFRIIMAQIGVVTGNVVDILADLGTSILNVGKTMSRLLQGDFVGAKEAFIGIGESIGDATEKVINFGSETKREIAEATRLTEKRNKVDEIQRQLLVDRAQADRDIAALREEAADKENITIERRIEAITEAGRIEEEITKKEIAAKKLLLEAQIAENALAGSTKEDLEKEAQLRADVINLETAQLKLQKALTAEITTALREQETERKAADAKKAAEDKAKAAEELALEKELANQKNLIRDALAVTEADRQALEIVKTREKYAALMELETTTAEERIALKKAEEEAIAKIVNKTGEEAVDNTKKWSEMTAGEKRKQASASLANLKTNLGTESAAGKAAATSEALINTYEGAQGAYASLSSIPIVGPVLGAAAAAAAIVAGFKNVQAIKATPVPFGGSSVGVSAPTPVAAAPATPPPAFNVVGATAQSQLAETIASTTNKPVKAYVVSSDVSTQQELDRKTRLQATLGNTLAGRVLSQRG